MSIESKISIGNAIEGECYVGKTTTLETIRNSESLRERGIIIVPEYSVIGELPQFPRYTIQDVKNAIQRMIDLEKRRTDKLASDLAHTNEALVIFDRGPVTCIAFEKAAEKMGFKSATLWLAEAFQREIEDKNILIPNGMIHLTASEDTIKMRELDRIKNGGIKVFDFLRDKDVIESLNDTFALFGEGLPKQLFLTLETDHKNPDDVCAEVLQFIRGQTSEVSDNIPDFLSFAKSLL